MVIRLPGPPPVSAASVLDRAEATRVARAGLAAVRSSTLAPGERPPGAQRDAPSVFRRAGDLWEIGFDGVSVNLAHVKGFEDLQTLLRQPGREIHCVDLARAGVEQPDNGEVIDAVARRRYEARLLELQADIDEATEHHDLRRAERAQAEFDAIVEHLTAALGLKGKARRTGGTAERSRSAVTHRVKAAIRRIHAAHPSLGRHLERAVITGSYCRYEPDAPVHWTT
jgi:hypothetical protein